MSSIITKVMNRCYLCHSYKNIEIHHIYSGCYRKKSTRYGLVVPLCHECHQGTNGVHFNRQKMDYLRVIGQLKFEEVYPDLDFLKVFGRDYKHLNINVDYGEEDLLDLEDLDDETKK